MKKHLCECGCGQETGVADRSDRKRGVVRGQQRRFVKGHGWRNRPERHNMSHTPTHRSWIQMRARCQRKTYAGWAHYGGRGVRVCDRWEMFENFLADMGERPIGKSLDRYPNNNGNYEPGNCRWATPKQQAENRRSNALLTINGVTKTQSQWCRESSLHVATFRGRLSRGWPAADALAATVARRKQPARLVRVPLPESGPDSQAD